VLPVIHQFLTMSKYRYMDLTTAAVSTPEVNAFCDYLKSTDLDVDQAYDLLEKAIQSQKDVCRQQRSGFSLHTAYLLFLMSRSFLQKLWIVPVFVLSEFVLRRAGCMRFHRRDIVISHPGIYPEIPLVGRPGIRLPYVTYFALHYQIWEDKTIITMMPGRRWQVKNEKFIKELEQDILSIVRMARAKQ
jgi:hypothetical protein